MKGLNVYRFFLLLSVLALSSCSPKDPNPASLKWVTVDMGSIKKHLYTITTDQNERYKVESPEDIALKADSEALRKQVKDLEKINRIQCEGVISKKKNELLDDITKRNNGSSGNSEVTNMEECLKNLEKVMELQALKAKYSLARSTYYQSRSKFRNHDFRVKERANRIAEDLVRKYAKGKFDLVIDSRSKTLYNKANAVLDVTDAVKSSIDMSLVNFDINTPYSFRQ